MLSKCREELETKNKDIEQQKHVDALLGEGRMKELVQECLEATNVVEAKGFEAQYLEQQKQIEELKSHFATMQSFVLKANGGQAAQETKVGNMGQHQGHLGSSFRMGSAQ